MLGKRAQTEDYFADFIPAVIVIVVALFIGTALSAVHTGKVERHVNSAAVQFNGMDVFSLMRMPVDGYGDFAHLADSIAEAYEAKDTEFFEFGAIARLGSEYAECGENFVKIVDGFFADKGWVIYIYEVVDPASESSEKMIFKCDNLKSFSDPAITSGTGIRYSHAFLPASGFTAYKVSVGWKDE